METQLSEFTRPRKLALAFVVGSILLVGGLPRDPDPQNLAHWRANGGLRLEAPSQLQSDGPIRLANAGFTLEVWLSPDPPKERGNQEILSFVDGPGVRPLVLGQWPAGFFLRSRSQNPRGLPELDRYGRHAVATSTHLAVVGADGLARLFVDGARTQVATSLPEMPMEGRLLLGSSATGWALWSGDIQAVAVYDRPLGADEIRRHAETSPRDEAQAAADRAATGETATSNTGLVAFYHFDQGRGQRVPSLQPGAPALVFPDRVVTPGQSLLNFSPSIDASWFRRDVALNLLGFIPLGMLIAWRGGRRGPLRALLVGFLLSLALELCQVFIPGRNSSAIDLASNTLGAVLGSLLAFGLTRRRD